MASGIVKWFNDKKGYGFIVSDGAEQDIFVHYSEIQTQGFRSLDKGEVVEFELFQDDKGARAREVTRTIAP